MAEDYTNLHHDEMFTPVDIDKPNYIKVVGVGGGGGNAVNHMMEEGIQGVDFVLCNTDHQALLKSKVKTTVHLGKRELGAGNDPRSRRIGITLPPTSTPLTRTVPPPTTVHR